MASFNFTAAGALIVLVATCAMRPSDAGQLFNVRTVSSRADAVSGGDVLVQLSAPNGSEWTARLNGRDVTRAFHPAEGSGDQLAVLIGLQPGKNTLEIRVNGAVKSTLEIVDHPLAGPIFSGRHQEPFICETVENGLGPATDADCNAKTLVEYYYKSTEPAQGSVAESIKATILAMLNAGLDPGFKPYSLSSPSPSDVAQTTTSDGRTVPYIIRREFGVINRAVYDIRFLHQPGTPLPTPWRRPTAGWNGRLVYVFGGGVRAGYHQGRLPGVVGGVQEPLLALGYALATSTLNVFGNTSNDKISAETLAMVREHFIKQYGKPVHTIGWGGSGGAMEQYLIAQNYPGLLDGMIPEASFPDLVSRVALSGDCSLLDHAFKTAKRPWTEEQKTAVSGFASWRTCEGWALRLVDPQNCDPSIPKAMIYDPIANPKGVRCDIYDNEVNVLGRNPHTGFTRRPLDNIGVQYGLVAFNAGRIDAEQFVELNERMGGYDEDGHIIAVRMEADPESLRLAYQRGLLMTGGGGLSQVPIIDWRSYSDDLADNHDFYQSFVTRARLIAANGNADNQVIVINPRVDSTKTLFVDPATSLNAERGRNLLRQMDRWLDNIAADSAGGSLPAKVKRDKPADLSDACWKVDGERIAEPATYEGPGKCNQIYPAHGASRIVASGPLTDDVLKCVLKPIDIKDYIHPLSNDQLDRLKAVFSTGVCDYSRLGVGQQVTEVTWEKFN